MRSHRALSTQVQHAPHLHSRTLGARFSTVASTGLTRRVLRRGSGRLLRAAMTFESESSMAFLSLWAARRRAAVAVGITDHSRCCKDQSDRGSERIQERLGGKKLNTLGVFLVL